MEYLETGVDGLRTWCDVGHFSQTAGKSQLMSATSTIT